MRWKWLIPRLLIVTVVWLGFTFGFDPLVRYTAMHSLQAVTGARADIDRISTGFFPPVVIVEHVALASASTPGTNLVEFDSLNCHLAGTALLHRNFVLEDASLHGVRFGTIRNDDGQLEKTDDEPAEPSWLTEKIRNVGSEWLELLAGQAEEQLDPNRLETWRVSQELGDKWQHRLNDLRGQVDDFKPRANEIEERLNSIKQLPSAARIEKYLQLAGEGELLLREATQIKNDISGIVPEAREDLARLDQARRNDQDNVIQTVRSLRPDSRRITESLLGPDLYRQLNQTLTWLELGRQYQQELSKRTEPERMRGTDVEFPLLNPTPRLLCRRMQISGEIALHSDLMPFHAVLSDVASDPMLHGIPSILRLKATGKSPLTLAVRHDLTHEIPRTDIVAEFSQPEPGALRVGKSDTAMLEALLTDLHWSAQVQVSGDDLNGVIKLDSGLGNTDVQSEKMNDLLRSAVTDVFTGIHQVSASVNLSGTVRQPGVHIESDLGEQVANGLHTALTTQADQLKATLMAQVNELATEKQQELSQLLQGRYQELLDQHGSTIKQLQSAQQLLAGFRNGTANPEQLIRTVSESGILSDQKNEKLNREVQKASRFLDGLRGVR